MSLVDIDFIFSYIIWDIDPIFFQIGFLKLRYYSLLFAMAMFLGHKIMSIYLKSRGWSKKETELTFLYFLIPLVIFSHFFHLLFYEISAFTKNPIRILQIGQGLSSHGGVFGLILGIILFSYRYKKNVLEILDAAGFASACGGIFIRFGNFFNSEIIGEPTNLPWGVIFLARDTQPRHPSQLYEALSLLSVFILLLVIYKIFKSRLLNGTIACLTLISLFSYRFVIEVLKVKQVEEGMDITLKMGQILSLPYVIISLFLLIYIYNKEKINQKLFKKI